jgi:hypothetical protein
MGVTVSEVGQLFDVLTLSKAGSTEKNSLINQFDVSLPILFTQQH